jgi:hypothetical protein
MSCVQRHFADIDDVSIHYITAGKGDPVVLLHGIPQTSGGRAEENAGIRERRFRPFPEAATGVAILYRVEGTIWRRILGIAGVILRQTGVAQAHADARSQRSSDPARGRQVVRAEPMSERSPL